jgi:glycosyltransferase involved in cell wall biosynthesis
VTPRNGITRPEPELISVIIPAFNAGEFIGEQLGALVDQDYPGRFEVIVADNGSNDDTVGVARRFGDRLDIRIVHASGTRGPGPARNAGAEGSKGSLLAFVDADDVAAPSWLSLLVSSAREWDLVGGPLDYAELNSPEVRAWRVPWPMDRLPVKLGFLPFAHSGNLAVWREVFESLGGFCPVRSEDVEFSWRAQLEGWGLGFAPDAVVHYRQRATLRAHLLQQLRWGYTNCRDYRQFRDNGLKRRPLWRAVLDFGWFIAQAPWALRRSPRRGAWLGKLSYRMGQLAGNIRYRVLFL